MRALRLVVAWMLILGIGTAVAVAVLVPRLGGATPYTVLTSSMRPGLSPGTLVVVRPVDVATLAVGTVITYQRESGRPDIVTHRVVEVDRGPDGQPRFRTQGDANPVPDAGWVRPTQVKGRLWYSVPYLGRANLALSGDQRRTAAVVVAVGLLVLAGSLWGVALRERAAA